MRNLTSRYAIIAFACGVSVPVRLHSLFASLLCILPRLSFECFLLFFFLLFLTAPLSPVTLIDRKSHDLQFHSEHMYLSVVLPLGMGVLFLPLYNIRHPAVPPAGDVPTVQKEESSGKVSSLLFDASSEMHAAFTFHRVIISEQEHDITLSAPDVSPCFKGMETCEWWSDVRSSACGRIWVRGEKNQPITHSQKRQIHQELLTKPESNRWLTEPAVGCRVCCVFQTFGPKWS